MTSKSKQTKRTIKDYFAKLKINTFENLDEWTVFEEDINYLGWLQKKRESKQTQFPWGEKVGKVDKEPHLKSPRSSWFHIGFPPSNFKEQKVPM